MEQANKMGLFRRIEDEGHKHRIDGRAVTRQELAEAWNSATRGAFVDQFNVDDDELDAVRAEICTVAEGMDLPDVIERAFTAGREVEATRRAGLIEKGQIEMEMRAYYSPLWKLWLMVSPRHRAARKATEEMLRAEGVTRVREQAETLSRELETIPGIETVEEMIEREDREKVAA
jgi:hypothetical protein